MAAAAPPVPSPAARGLIAALDRLSRLGPRQTLLVALAGYAGALTLDLATGRGINVIPVYGAVTCFAAWTRGERGGLGMAAAICIGMVALPFLRMLAGDPGPTEPWRLAWNSANRSLVLAVLALAVSTLRCLLALERWRADTDALTGALNKGAFNRQMAGAVARAQRGGRSLVLAYMDLDGFKQVNDCHGHSAGDRVLQAFTAGATDAIRRDDLFARIGGDEFVVLMTVPDCTKGEAAAEALHDRLRRVLAETGLPVSCSMGALVAEAAHVEAGDDMIGLADGLMYEVKRSGKDALRIARGGPAATPSGAALRTAFPPAADAPFAGLLGRIDEAARRAA